jgi:deoxyribodipyrimidine photo-lyase
MIKPVITIMWFRRDLRLSDNVALYEALKNGLPVVPLFIFDKNILDDLEDKADRRVAFIYATLLKMQAELIKLGSSLEVYYSTPVKTFQLLLGKYAIASVFTNRDYEQYAIQRDAAIETILQQKSVSFNTYKDQVIFEKKEITKEDGLPYTIFTPYSNKWKAAVTDETLKNYATETYFSAFYKQPAQVIPSLEAMGLIPVDPPLIPSELNAALIEKYTEQRNFPAINGTSRMGIHLRFGTVSIRHLVRQALKLNETFLNELIWREFYQMILWNFPQISEGRAFKKEYDLIEWRNDKTEFQRWCEGKTGYPIVDAGMRELNATGYMHNRLRMIVASFLSKHLLIDWRWGEEYFAKKLLDYDFAANNGGWQWAAGSGCDAAPYFRVFNPTLQTRKFDKDLKYIRKWVPELDSFDYPAPMVAHEIARKRALEAYGKALKRD